MLVPQGAKVKVEGPAVKVEGPKGKLELALAPFIKVKVEGDKVKVDRTDDSKQAMCQHGTTRAHIANMVRGVTQGFEKTLEISGSGYNAKLAGDKLTLLIGLTHPVELKVPAGLTVEVPGPTIVTVRGADRQKVGQFAADLRAVRPVEPYKLKGIKYRGEYVKKKAGKAAAGTAAK